MLYKLWPMQKRKETNLTMLYKRSSTQCHHLNKFGKFEYPLLFTKFKGLLVPKKDIFEDLYPYMGLEAILVM